MILLNYTHQDRAKSCFNAIVKGNNVFTPQHEKTFYIGKFIVEITSGTGMRGQAIYGIAVVDTLLRNHDSNLSCMCYSEAEIEEHLEEIKALNS